MCIVPAPNNCRYIALSYVWGNATQLQLSTGNIAQLSQDHRLFGAGVSATIQDTIKLVERLDERYLWDDALCIMSDHAGTRKGEIARMDEIYAGSLLTVVAGACANANEPLRGVSTERCSRQVTREVFSELILMAHLDAKDLFNQTVYQQRAWT
jgi:hypothetical protein